MPTTPIWSKISDLKPFEAYDLDPGWIFRKIYWVSSDAQTVIAVRRGENVLKEYIRDNNNAWTVKTNYNILLFPAMQLNLNKNDSLEEDYFIYISKLKTKIVIFEKTSHPNSYGETPYGMPFYEYRKYFRVLIYNINSDNTVTLSNTINPSRDMLPPGVYLSGTDTFTYRSAPTFRAWNFVMSDNGNIMILIEEQNSVLNVRDKFTAWNVMLSINGGATFSTLLGGHDTQGNNTNNFSGYSITTTKTTSQFEPYITDNGIFLHYGTKSISSNRYYLYKINVNVNTIELVDFKKFNASAGLGTYYIDWNNTSNGLPVDLSTPANRTIKSISQNGSTLYASFQYVYKNSSKEVGKVGVPSSYGSSGGLNVSNSNAPNGINYFYNGSSSENKLTVCNDIGDKYFAVTKDNLNQAGTDTPIILWYFENYGKINPKQIILNITEDILKPYSSYFWGQNIKLYWLNQNTIILSYTVQPTVSNVINGNIVSGSIQKTRILYAGSIQTTPLPLPTRTPFPTRTPAPTPTRTPIPVPTRTPAPTPTKTLTTTPFATPTPSPNPSPTPQSASATDSELFFKKNGEYKFYESAVPNNPNQIIQQQASYSISFNNSSNIFNGVSASDLSNRRNFSYVFNDPGAFGEQYKPLSYIFYGYGKKPYLNNDAFMYLYQGGEDAIIIRLPIESYMTFLYLHPAFGGTSDIGSVTYDIRLDSNRLIKTGWPNSSISVMSDNDNSWRVIIPKLHDTNYIMGPNYIPINQVCKYIKIQKLSYELNNNSTNYGLLLLKGLAPMFGALPTPTPSLPVSPTPTPSSTSITKTCLDSSSGGPTYQTYFVLGNTQGSVIGSNTSGYSCSTMLGCDSTTGSQIDPISLGAAAVHAGLLLNNTAGTIYIINNGWKSSFTGSISNGVTSRSSSIGSCSVKLSLGPTATPTSTPTRTPTPTSTPIYSTPTPTVPDNINRQVRNLTVRGGNETVYVSFDAPINTNPSVFVGYRIYYAIGLNGSWIDVTNQITKSDGIYSPYGDSIPYTDVNNNVISRMNISFNLPNGYNYAIKVAAGYNVTGYSKWNPKLYDVISPTRVSLAPNILTDLSANASLTTWYGSPAIQFTIIDNPNTSSLNIFSNNVYTPFLDSYNFDTKVIDGSTLNEYPLQNLINDANSDTFANPSIMFIEPGKTYYITFNKYSASYKLSFKAKNILHAKTVSSLGDTHKTVYKQTSIVYNLNAPTPTSTPSSTPTRTPGPTPTRTTTPTSTPVPTATPRVIVESASSSLSPTFDIEYVRNSSTGDLDAIIKIIPVGGQSFNKKIKEYVYDKPALPPDTQINIQGCSGRLTYTYGFDDQSPTNPYTLADMRISFYKNNDPNSIIAINYEGILRSIFYAKRESPDDSLYPIYTLRLTRQQLLSLVHTDYGNGTYKIYAQINGYATGIGRNTILQTASFFPSSACVGYVSGTTVHKYYETNRLYFLGSRVVYRNIVMPIQSTFNANQIWLNYGKFLITDNLVSSGNPLGNVFRSISPLSTDGTNLINGSGFDTSSCYNCWGYGVSSSSLSSIIDLGAVLTVSSVVFIPYSLFIDYWVPIPSSFGQTGVVCEVSNDGITWKPIPAGTALNNPSIISDNTISINQLCRYIRLRTNGPGKIVLKKFKPIIN